MNNSYEGARSENISPWFDTTTFLDENETSPMKLRDTSDTAQGVDLVSFLENLRYQ